MFSTVTGISQNGSDAVWACAFAPNGATAVSVSIPGHVLSLVGEVTRSRNVTLGCVELAIKGLPTLIGASFLVIPDLPGGGAGMLALGPGSVTNQTKLVRLN